MNRAVIVAAKRTPIGKVGGILKDFEPDMLASFVIESLLHETKVSKEEINDVILGNVVGPGGNIARLAALTAGLPYHVPGVTVDRQCGSGLEAVNLAARLVQAGAGDIYLAGGVESTSRAPWKVEKPTSLYREAPHIFTRARFSTEEIGDPEMGEAAENVAEKYNISKDKQDLYSLKSHQKAVKAMESGRYLEELVPVHLLTRTGEKMVIAEDECPRKNTTIEKLSKLKPVFRENGTVTAGNACPINDGAALVLIMSERKCRELGLVPKLCFIDSAAAGVDPNFLGIGPVPAVTKLLNRTGLSMIDIDLVEFNEAFASQVLASLQLLNIPEEKVNVSGGALALGHPYGASGAVLVTRLMIEMKQKKARYGLATLGIGGGLGLASLFERIEE
ncbi:thiolase family protein [Bacillus taeanensis]|uniref:Acetyl-CoA C-acyltransferase n=1 Tax=Bacillus taeanensis TaxID=273032 RepID=A0A366Y3C6_9BACI|nr:thiolase family protein [Bacillus taeanensis]RBW70884.1 acetyl-CoA C-acyltransferase [Bacillus taeanensis]